MTSAQVVETSVTNNSSFQNYTHPDDHTIRTSNLLSIQNEATSLVSMSSKELCLVEENHATVKPDSRVAPHEIKLTAKAELKCEIYKS